MGSYSTLQLITVLCILSIGDLIFCSNSGEGINNSEDVSNQDSSDYTDFVGDPTWKLTDKNKTVMELLPKLDGEIQDSWENTNPFYVAGTLNIICNVSREYFEKEIEIKFGRIRKNGTTIDAQQLNKTDLVTDSYTNTVSQEISITFLDTNMDTFWCFAKVINSTTWRNVSQEIVILPSFGAVLVNNTNQTIETEEKRHKLSCTASGAPRPIIQWFRIDENGNAKKTSGVGLNFSDGPGHMETTSDLEVDVWELDIGSSVVYLCKASNFRSSDTQFFTVTRDEPFQIGKWMISIGSCVAVIIMIGAFVRWMPGWIRRRQDQRTEIRTSQLEIKSTQSSLKYGEFGDISLAKLKPSNIIVVVKTLKKPKGRGFDRNAVYLFSQELKILKRVGKHPNIVEYIGQVTKNRKPEKCKIVMKYYEQGDLLKYLEKNKPTVALDGYEDPTPAPVRNTISQQQMIRWCKDVACGVEYLASKRIVHGDLAARNVLLDSIDNELVAVVTDFGLSKELIRKEDGTYFYKSSGRPLPAALCSIEVLENFVYSEDSDIWAFGVLMYEIFSYGQVPYENELRDYLEAMGRRQNESEDVSCKRDLLLEFLKSERRLLKPAAASDDVFVIMERCWARELSQRPRFSVLKIDLENLNEQVEMDIINGSVAYNDYQDQSS